MTNISIVRNNNCQMSLLSNVKYRLWFEIKTKTISLDFATLWCTHPIWADIQRFLSQLPICYKYTPICSQSKKKRKECEFLHWTHFQLTFLSLHRKTPLCPPHTTEIALEIDCQFVYDQSSIKRHEPFSWVDQSVCESSIDYSEQWSSLLYSLWPFCWR